VLYVAHCWEWCCLFLLLLVSLYVFTAGFVCCVAAAAGHHAVYVSLHLFCFMVFTAWMLAVCMLLLLFRFVLPLLAFFVNWKARIEGSTQLGIPNEGRPVAPQRPPDFWYWFGTLLRQSPSRQDATQVAL
jgi:hypothetical protein